MRVQTKNYKQANKGKFLEEMVEMTNYVYENKRYAKVQKISTPTKVVWGGGKIVGAYHSGKSTLDFRGTLKGGQAIAFDCKETKEEKGLPLSIIAEHQIDYIRSAIEFGEIVFIVCHLTSLRKYFFIKGQVVIDYWDSWQRNKGKRGYNCILKEDMIEIKGSRGVPLDYLLAVEEIC